MLEEFLGNNSKNEKSIYQKNVQNFFKLKRNNISNQVKEFRNKNFKGFKNEFEVFVNKLNPKGLDWDLKKENFYKSIQTYLINLPHELDINDLLSLKSAVKNFRNLDLISSDQNLLSVQSLILEKLSTRKFL